jgi:hypothetical protein
MLKFNTKSENKKHFPKNPKKQKKKLEVPSLKLGTKLQC